MKWIFRVLLIVIIALVVAVVCGLPALNWVAWLFNGIGFVFNRLGELCSILQKLVNWGIIK